MALPPNERKTIERILADSRYWDPAHPEHAAVKAEAARAFQDAYPGSSDNAPTSAVHVRAYTREQNGKIIQVSDYDRTAGVARAPASTRSPSGQGLSFLKKAEGFRYGKYPDEAQNDTIGYGHKIRSGESFPDGITREQAEKMFEADVAEATAAVRRLVKFEITQAQFDALVSLVYNVGSGAFAKSKMLRKLNTGDTAGAATEFEGWDRITNEKGQRVPDGGLTDRRRREKNLFLNGAYQ